MRRSNERLTILPSQQVHFSQHGPGTPKGLLTVRGESQMLSIGSPQTKAAKVESFTFSVGAFRVAAAVAGGSQPAKEFFLKDLTQAERTKMQILFDYIAVSGRIKNREKFKKIEDTDDLFEFKCHQIRMPCFWDKHGTLWITHGFKKKQERTPEGEKTRAKEIRNAHKTSAGDIQ